MAEDAVGAEREYGLVWIGKDLEEAPEGTIRTIRLTGTTTLSAHAWTHVPLTVIQAVPAGTWGVVGMWAKSANGICARLVFPGSKDRPGVICNQQIENRDKKTFRRAKIGLWGTFTHRSLPSAEWFASAADTAEEVFLDVVYMGLAVPVGP